MQLKKRQKYDPRKAILQAKKKPNTNNKENQRKSAFPEGFLKGQTLTKDDKPNEPIDEDEEFKKLEEEVQESQNP